MNAVERKELKHNASGYADSTAYLAMMNADAPKCGDIWTDERDREFLVIAVNNNICTCLLLEVYERANGIQIISRDIRYTNVYMISYMFADRLKEFVKAMKDDAFAGVMKAVGDALKIQSVPKDQTERIKLMEAELAEWKEAHRKAINSAAEAQDKLAEAERALYEAAAANHPAADDGMPWERMYHDLLDRILQKSGLNG